MTYWKAWAAARAVPDADLREVLITALDKIEDLETDLSDALACQQELETDAINEAEERAAEAENRLEEYLQGSKIHADFDKLREEFDETRDRLTAAEARAKDAEERLENSRLIVENYSDMLALARRVTSAIEGVKLPKQHVRSVKPANDAKNKRAR